MKILIAEDDFTSRTMLKAVLNKLGHEVVVAVDGAEAWEIMQQPDAPRLAILDWVMPHLDGLEVCRRVRALATEFPPHLIMLTSKHEKVEVIAGLEAGADDYLAKPFDPGELRARVRVGLRTIEMLTHLREAEEQLRQASLRQSEDRYRRILQVAQEGILTTDRDFHLTFVNRSLERIFGESATQLLQRPLESFLHLEEGNDFSTWKAGRRSGKSESYERAIQCSDGRTQFLMVSVTPIMGPEGEFDGVFAMMTDITERKHSELQRQQMEIQLRHSQKLEAIGQLAAGIAHEINTPTQYIGDNAIFLQDAFSDLLAFLSHIQEKSSQGELEGDWKDRIEALDLDYLQEEIPRAIQQSLEGVGRVSKIVSAMKDFSHPGGSVREPVDLNRAIESTITVSHNAWKYVATLETDFDPQLPLVPCFPDDFNQVILNLLVNSAHAIEEASAGKTGMGLIRVSTRKAGDWVEIRISDTGTGIPEAIRSRIFDPFFTTKAVGKGTGQGLSIARAVIVEKHGGQIDLLSSPGEGTTFILRLPLIGI